MLQLKPIEPDSACFQLLENNDNSPYRSRMDIYFPRTELYFDLEIDITGCFNTAINVRYFKSPGVTNQHRE